MQCRFYITIVSNELVLGSYISICLVQKEVFHTYTYCWQYVHVQSALICISLAYEWWILFVPSAPSIENLLNQATNSICDLRSVRWFETSEFDDISRITKTHCPTTLPPNRTQPKKLCTANFSSGTLKTLIDGPLWLKNKKIWRRPAEKKHFSSLPRARTPLSSG